MIAALLGVLAVLLLTAGTALFVAAEFSLVAVERPQLEAAEREGDAGAARVLASVRTLSFQLSGAQLGITMTTLVVGFIAEPSFAAFFGPPLEAAGLPAGLSAGIALAVALLIATVLQIVFGELVPKNLAIAQPMPTARAVAGPLRVFSAVLRPLIAACNASANAVVRRFGIEPQEELRSARSASELGSLVRSSAEEGTLTEQTATMLTRSLAFGDRNAGDVMTPRMQMVSLEQGDSVARLLELAHESGHSRFPVEGSDGVDDVIGVVHVKKAFAVPREDRKRTRVSQVMGPVARVPESVHCDDLLRTLREPGLQMAVVIDEFGGTAGVVTLEDLVEELVGEVDDEHDAPRRPDVEHRADDTLVLSGLLRDDQVADVCDFVLPEGPYDTLGGLVMQRLGRLPRKGDEVEVDGWQLTVLEVDGRRVDRVQLVATPRDPRGHPVTTVGLLAAVLLLAGNAFFVGAEFAVICVRRSQVEPLADGSRRARVVLDALRHLSLMLAAAQLGITLCSLGLGAVAEPAVAHLLEDALHAVRVPEQLLHPIAFAIALSLVVFLHMVLGEMVPKNIAIASPERAALVLVPALYRFSTAVGPLLRGLNAFGNGVLRAFRVEPKDELASSFSPDELAGIIAHSREEGLLDEEEHERLSGALELGSQPASTVMLPLDRLVTVEAGVTADDLEELVVITGFSRFPVRSAVRRPRDRRRRRGRAPRLRPRQGRPGPVRARAPRAPGAAAAAADAQGAVRPAAVRRPALLQRSQSHLGQVVDEDGSAVGVIALEDVVEQFVGEVEDENTPLNAPALADG